MKNSIPLELVTNILDNIIVENYLKLNQRVLKISTLKFSANFLQKNLVWKSKYKVWISKNQVV